MGNKEAISILRHLRNLLTTRAFEEDALDITIQSIEKQVPKKPTDRCMYKECPACGEVEIEFCKYCPSCGQKLDWGNKE